MRAIPFTQTGTSPRTKSREAARFSLIPHPGFTLKEDFMEPLGLSAYAVAKAVGSTPITISMITRGKRAVSAEMALRLGRYTGTSAEFWMNLQAGYSLRMARARKAAEIDRRVVPLQPPA